MALSDLLGRSGPAEDPHARDELERLSDVVSSGLRHFVTVGDALAEIRDRDLYRMVCPTFEQYCRGKWEMTPQHAGRLIDAANVARNLAEHGLSVETERQARALKPLPADEQVAVVREASASSKPMGSTIAESVAKRSKKRKPKVAKAMTVRVPGCSIKLTPNGKFEGDYEQALEDALDKLRGTASIERRRAA